MAQQPPEPAKQGILRRIFGRHNSNDSSIPVPNEKVPSGISGPELEPEPVPEPEREVGSKFRTESQPIFGKNRLTEELPHSPHGASPRPGSSRRTSYNVIPGLPRAQTFKRQQSEQRTHLQPVQPTPDERRALSVDRRSSARQHSPIRRANDDNPRVSAPGNLGPEAVAPIEPTSSVTRSSSRFSQPSGSENQAEALTHVNDYRNSASSGLDRNNVPSMAETHSVADSCYEDDDIIARELDTKWILNLSMHFRDRSKREKFFVTYRQEPHVWRRVTISLDYRNAPPDSLESQLDRTRYQRDKIAKIYEAIRESLDDIQFYDTVTNLKLQTVDGRLYVHVMEDGNEIIHYPPVREVRHLRCTQVRERDIAFDSHMSGFVYKVQVGDKMLIKKEIPSPETVDEFLYEINALNALGDSENVIDFYGVVVDDHSQVVKGLLIDYADRGTLIDILYEHREHNIPLPWKTREKWARQIVQGLADVHESGFVQGDFTLSNIVITKDDDARIIDINRRGCPVGWEPPEAAALIESGHRIAMYIGVKSDLYQLGMVLWAIAVLEDEPEMRGRPLFLAPDDDVPDWYRQLTDICLSPHPKSRLQAVVLIDLFPPLQVRNEPAPRPRLLHTESTLRPKYGSRSPSEERRSGLVEQPSSEWSHVSRTFTGSGTRDYGSSYYPPRGRSPPSRQPSTPGDYVSPRHMSHRTAAWCEDVDSIPPSYYGEEDILFDHGKSQHAVPDPSSGEPRELIMDESAQTLRADAVSDAEPDPEPLDHGDALDGTPPAEVNAGVSNLLVEGQPHVGQDVESEETPLGPTMLQESVLAHQPPDGVAREANGLEQPVQTSAFESMNEIIAETPDAGPIRAEPSSSEDKVPVQMSTGQNGTIKAASMVGVLSLGSPERPVTLGDDQIKPIQTPKAPEMTGQSQAFPPSGQDTSTDVSAGLQPPQASSGSDLPEHAECAWQKGSVNIAVPRGLFADPLQSSSAPISRRVTDESVTTLPRARPSSDGVAAVTAVTAPRSCDPGPPATMSFSDMSGCLAGIGGGLDDAMIDGGPPFRDDDFSLLGCPPHLMISTDANTG